ncbi:delta-class carbonic anhydrase [Uliginosibacterium sediminicola]|uniref:Delta-class carbonic anhydrase n=1 Tax=Uliginosibacterium sediminicola TaxID=2024550 RepID=A0ABU9Z3L6_9RHOO
MKKSLSFLVLLSAFTGTAQSSTESPDSAAAAIAAQELALERNTADKGFGPQSPRDLAKKKGENKRYFSPAPAYQNMNLCNIHFHTNAEHKGGDFTTFAGYGDGHGSHTGYRYNGKLSAAESKPLAEEVCKSEHGGLQAGDTIELHYVHSSAMVTPGPTLNSCLSEADSNPQLRVEAQVLVLVNNPKAVDFNKLAAVGQVNGFYQALHIPKATGKPIQYAGSTTGPAYNEKGSPLQVSWSVRPRVLKVSAESLAKWCGENVFKEDHAHGVRNLVRNVKLLSPMK